MERNQARCQHKIKRLAPGDVHRGMTTDRVSATCRRLPGIPLVYLALALALVLTCWLAACATTVYIPDATTGQAPSRDLERVRPAAVLADVSGASRIALVIGNAAYQQGDKLPNAKHDAQDIAAVLKALHFEVIEGINQNQRQMRASVRAFRSKLAASRGVGFFYYAGHGVQHQNASYLVPIGANIEYEADIEDQAIAAQWVLDTMDGAGNGLNVVVLDACRNNPLGRGFNRSFSGLAKPGFQGKIGTLIAYSTAPGRTAKDGGGRNSPYTKYLKAALAIPGLELVDVFRWVGAQVERETKQAQRPWRSGSANARFYFTPRSDEPEPLPVSVAQGPPVLAAIADPARRPVAVFRDALKDGGEGPQMVVLPTGRFRMGSPSGETGRDSDEGPVRTVTIGKRIAMGRYEVTFAEYDRFVAATSGRRPNDLGWGRGSRPVIRVSQEDAKAYAIWLSAQTGKTYRLPTEAEWEYAARAGTTTTYSWGNEIGVNRANCDGCGSEWDDEQTAPVGSFAPNGFGLFDMHGNVYEWVADCWHGNYEGAPTDGSAWTASCDSSWAVVRGGSWLDGPRLLRAANRYWPWPSSRLSFIGFRLVQDLNP